MKNYICALAVLAAVFSTQDSFASRARVLAMGTGDGGAFLGGTGNNGSFHYNDAYNIFYNPAYINTYKNWAAIEKSNFSGDTAEGGFVTSFLNYNLGLYFNRVDGMSRVVDMDDTTNESDTYSNWKLMRPVDIIIGADMGIKWGLSLSTASYTSNKQTQKDLTGKIGAQIEDFEPFVHYKFIGKDQTKDLKFKDVAVGLKYHYGEWSPYFVYNSYKQDFASAADITSKSWGIGLSRFYRIAEGVDLGYSTGYFVTNRTPNVGSHQYRRMVPFNLFAEGDVTTWLALRGGLQFNISDQLGDGNSNTTDSTTGRFGATFKFNSFNLDWVIGGAGAGDETIDNTQTQSFDIASGFFTAASLVYNW